jgi:hypothetical protein
MNHGRNLRERLQRVRDQEANVAEINWVERRDEWLEGVAELYEKVKEWLAEYTRDKLVTISSEATVQLHDEHMGDYQAHTLVIAAGPHTIVFEPIGGEIIGANGRIDLYKQGRRSELRLLLWLEDDGGTKYWGLWEGKYSAGGGVHFNQGVLEGLLEEWIQ